ncbi:MAG: penicillin-binding protein 2 [Acidobacteria bacterium]|nr:penicillin-binding protein 2 [Acidobacteriota bacterium]
MGPRALERESDRKRVLSRIRVLEWGLAGICLFLVLGFWQIQIVRGAQWAERAEANQHSTSRVRASRGLILDRHGEILATNQPSYEVALLREAIEDQFQELSYLSEILDVPIDVLDQRLESQRGVPRFKPVVVAEDVDPAVVVQLQARQREHPGIQVIVESKRHYPMGRLAAHVLGRVGEVSPRQLTVWGDPFRMGDIVGQQGVESIYNDYLFGLPGERYAQINSVGREVDTLRELAPHPGETVVLTIDAPLQGLAEELLAPHRGAAVVLNARTGGILTMASMPTFDPALFASRFSREQWDTIQTDPTKPLHNRAIQVVHAPGSIFKLVVAAAGLEEGVIDRNTTFFCPGARTFYGRSYRCLGSHGDVNVVEALAHSCNSFFYELGVKLGRDRIVKWAERFGLGDVTGVDLPSEEEGIIPSDEWLAANQRNYWPGETVSLAIGQGPLTVSPLQQAHLAATAATGFVRRPHLLLEVEASAVDDRQRSHTYEPDTRPADFGESTRATLMRGLAGSVAYGTSRRAQIADVAAGGKTGTAQVASSSRVAEDNADRPEHLRNHAWFVAVAPVENPEIAVAVFVEHGGSGGVVAAPIGGQLLAAYFGTEVSYREIAPTTEPVEETATDGAIGEER